MNDNRFGPEDEEELGDDNYMEDSSWYGDDNEDSSWEDDELDESSNDEDSWS